MMMRIFCVILIIMTNVSLVAVTPTDAFYDPDGKVVFVVLSTSTNTYICKLFWNNGNEFRIHINF